MSLMEEARKEFAPAASGMPPILNLHNAQKSYNSTGLTKDDAFGAVLIDLEGVSVIEKAGEGRKKQGRIHIILQGRVVETNVLGIVAGEVYSLFADGNLVWGLAGIKSDDADKESLGAWFDGLKAENRRFLIDYTGGKEITEGEWKGEKSHTYEIRPVTKKV